MRRLKTIYPWLLVFSIVVLLFFLNVSASNGFLTKPRKGDVYIMVYTGIDARRLPYKVERVEGENIVFSKSNFQSFNPSSESDYNFKPTDFDTSQVFVLEKKQLKMMHYNALVGIKLNASLRNK